MTLMLRRFNEQRDLNTSRIHISEILNRKRDLSLSMIRRFNGEKHSKWSR